jgi:general secretion pathway protein E
VLAQRLARTLCPQCKQPDPAITAEDLSQHAKPWGLAGPLRAHKAVGCPACRGTGYRGRAALYELMEVSEPVRQAMHPQLDLARLRRQAGERGLLPLRVAGLTKVAQGLTSLEEVLRCTPRWDSE